MDGLRLFRRMDTCEDHQGSPRPPGAPPVLTRKPFGEHVEGLSVSRTRSSVRESAVRKEVFQGAVSFVCDPAKDTMMEDVAGARVIFQRVGNSTGYAGLSARRTDLDRSPVVPHDV